MWPNRIPSAKNGQWYRKDIGSVPTGNWYINHYGAGINSIGDDVYAWIFNWGCEDPIVNRDWNLSPNEVPPGRIWKVTDYGMERITASTSAFDGLAQQVEGPYSSYYETYPNVRNGNLKDYMLPSAIHSRIASDNKYLYYLNGITRRLFKIDPSTGDFEYIALGRVNGGANWYLYSNPYTYDSINGEYADMQPEYTSNFIHKDGWLYWLERPDYEYRATDWMQNYILRRVKTEAPYTVESLWNIPESTPPTPTYWLEPQPDGYPRSIQHGQNPNIQWYDGRWGSPNIDYKDGWFYFSCSYYDGALGSTDSIVRWNGIDEAQTLFYQHTWYAGQNQYLDKSNWTFDWVKSRYESGSFRLDSHSAIEELYLGSYYYDGTFKEFPYQKPYSGVPQYEGYQHIGGMCVTNDNYIVTQNATTGNFASGWAYFGLQPVAFNINKLVAEYNSNGPLRHNRLEPFYRSVASGVIDDMGTDWNFYNRQRQWYDKAGSDPIIHHIAPSCGMHAPRNHSTIDKGFLGLVNGFNYMTTNNEWGGSTGCSNHVSWFTDTPPESSTKTTANITIRFFEKELKGYHNIHGGKRVPPPEVVEL